jgi:O-antigen/teichoic acid export membrane protein
MPQYINKVKRALIDPLLRIMGEDGTKGSIWFTTSTVIKTVVQLTTSMLVARWVFPENFGIWKSVVLIQAYINVLQLGIVEGLNRQYALYRGAGKDKVALDIAQAAFTFILLISLLSGVIVLIILGVFWFRGSNPKTLIALLFFTLQAIATPLWNYYDILFRSGQKFRTLGWIQFGEALYLIFSLVFVFFGGWMGMFVRFATIFPVGLLLRYLFRPIPVKLKFNFESLIDLSKIGLKVMLSVYIYGLVMVADRTLIASYLGQEALGIYSVAVTLGGALAVIPNAINKILFSRMTFRFGESDNAASLGRIAFLSEIYNALFLIVPTIALWFALEPLVSWALPAYTAGVMAAKWLVIESYIAGLRSSVTVFQTLNRMKEFILLLVVALGLMYVFGWLGIQNIGTIESVAKVKLIVMALLTLGVNLVSYKMVKAPQK